MRVGLQREPCKILRATGHKKEVHVQGCASPSNDIGEVVSLFQWLRSGGDRGSRMLFAGERGGGRNAPAAKPLK